MGFEKVQGEDTDAASDEEASDGVEEWFEVSEGWKTVGGEGPGRVQSSCQ